MKYDRCFNIQVHYKYTRVDSLICVKPIIIGQEYMINRLNTPDFGQMDIIV